MMKKILLAAGVLLVGSTAANAVILFSDNFNANPVANATTPAGWVLNVGTVDVTNAFGGVNVDMNGQAALPAAIETASSFNVVAGQSYKLSFDFGVVGSGFEVLTFDFAGYSAGSVSFGPSVGLSAAAFTFVAAISGPSVLSFSGLPGTGSGMILDNVLLESLAPVSPVPIPPAALLLGSGLIGLGALGRKRKN